VLKRVSTRPHPVLVFAYGNPSRGDDALGPLLLDELARRQSAGRLQGVELLTDFQLQVEHALDLVGRDRVVFVDASVSGAEPFSFCRVSPDRDASYTTHAMSPAAVLRVYEQLNPTPPPPTWLMAIRGYDLGLGTPVCKKANENLAKAVDYLANVLERSADELPWTPSANTAQRGIPG
jgi:hydrogenase maturation protease